MNDEPESDPSQPPPRKRRGRAYGCGMLLALCIGVPTVLIGAERLYTYLNGPQPIGGWYCVIDGRTCSCHSVRPHEAARNFRRSDVVAACPREFTCCRGLYTKRGYYHSTGSPCTCTKMGPSAQCDRDLIPSLSSLRPYRMFCP